MTTPASADQAGQALYESMQAARFGTGPSLIQSAARREFGPDVAAAIFSDKKRCYMLAYVGWTWAQVCQVAS